MNKSAGRRVRHICNTHAIKLAAWQQGCLARDFLNEKISFVIGNVFNRHWLRLMGWRINSH